MEFKKLSAAVAAMALIATLGAASVGAQSAASSSSSQSGSSSSQPQANPGHGGRRVFAGGDFGAFKALSTVTGMSVDDLMTKYPQKTSWQIAKQLGKLDEMKKTFLNNQKTFLDKLVAEGKISSDDSSKMYADLQKRVASIDGVNTVTLGRPGYRPQSKDGK